MGSSPDSGEVVAEMNISRQEASEERYESWEMLERAWEVEFPDKDGETMRRCVEFCYLFLKNYEFHKDNIAQLWIAEGFIAESDTNIVEAFETISIFKSCFDGGSVYRLNHSIAYLLEQRPGPGGEYYRDVDNDSRISETTLHASLTQGMDPALYSASGLITLMVSFTDFNHVPRDLFRRLCLIRVLDFSHTNITELPSSIGYLKNLRYLNLSGTRIETLPSLVCTLAQMQTLKLRDCVKLAYLPKDMRKLVELRHLEAGLACLLVSMPPGFGDLSKLETLPAFVVGEEDGCHITELKHMVNLHGTLRIFRLENVSNWEQAKDAALDQKIYLVKLVLQWTDYNDGLIILENLRPHKELQELQIVGYGDTKFPGWIGDPIFSKLVTISIHGCRNCELLSPLGKLPSLETLAISEMHQVRVIDHRFCGRDLMDNDNMFKGFPSLKSLTFDGMPKLEKWTGIMEGEFPCLQNLNIFSCSVLCALPQLLFLDSLENLEIRLCPLLKTSLKKELPKSLQHLVIIECPLLNRSTCQKEIALRRNLECIPNVWIDYKQFFAVAESSEIESEQPLEDEPAESSKTESAQTFEMEQVQPLETEPDQPSKTEADKKEVILRFCDDEPVESIPRKARITSRVFVKPDYETLNARIFNKREAPLEESNFKVMVELLVGDSAKDRYGLDLVMVLDVSGSMKGDKLRKMKIATQFVTKKLSPIDRLSIVTFATISTRLHPLRQITEDARVEIQNLVDGIVARGSTNITAGLQTGLKVLNDRSLTSGRVVGIMLMSDGLQSDDNDAAQVQVGNVPVYTFGLGNDYDPRVLKAIADNSMGGTFSDVQNEKNLSIAFSQCLAGLLTVVAVDLTLTVTQQKSIIEKVSAGNYPQSKDDDSVTISFGNLYANEVRKVIVDLHLPAVSSQTSADIVRITYVNNAVGWKKRSEVKGLYVTVTRVGSSVEPEREEVIQEENRIRCIQMMKEARIRADKDMLGFAQDMLAYAGFIMIKDVVDNPWIKMLKLELKQLTELMNSQWIYQKQGRSFALSFETCHARQRFAARGDVEKLRSYATPRMDAYLEQAKSFEEDPSIPLTSDLESWHSQETGVYKRMATEKTPMPLDIFSCPVRPSSKQDELHMTDGVPYNYSGQVIPSEALKIILTHPKLASQGREADIDSGRLSGMVFISDRNNLGTLHIALRFSDSHPEVKVFSFSDVFATFDGVRMEDIGGIAGDYLVYATTTKDPSTDGRQPWTVVYTINLKTGKTNRLTPAGQTDLSPSMSPSGKKIAVASVEEKDGWYGEIEDRNTDIFVMNVERPSERRLVVRNGGWPTWGSENVIFFHRKVGRLWGVFRTDISDLTPDITRVTPYGIHAFTPAAINATTVAVATIRPNWRSTLLPGGARQYRHIQIFDSSGEQEAIQVTLKITPKADHFNPFVIDGGKRIGYHRLKGELLMVREPPDPYPFRVGLGIDYYPFYFFGSGSGQPEEYY